VDFEPGLGEIILHCIEQYLMMDVTWVKSNLQSACLEQFGNFYFYFYTKRAETQRKENYSEIKHGVQTPAMSAM